MNYKTRKEIESSVSSLLNEINERLELCYMVEDNPYKMGALITACKKNLKRDLFLIYYREQENDLDLTYEVTQVLLKKLFNRGISTKFILDEITEKGRKTKSIHRREGEKLERTVEKISIFYFEGFSDSLEKLNVRFKTELQQLKNS